MQTDTRIAIEGLLIGLYRAGMLQRRQVEAVVSTMEVHAQDSKSLSSAIDIEQLLGRVTEALVENETPDDEDGF